MNGQWKGIFCFVGTIILMFIKADSLYAQEIHLNDSFFHKFELAIKKHLVNKKLIVDGNVGLFYGSKYYFYLEKVYMTDATHLSLKSLEFKDTITQDIVEASIIKNFGFRFRREFSYNDFTNFLMNLTDSRKCILRDIQSRLIFISCPMENWEQFYLDSYLNQRTLILTPTIDYFFKDKKKRIMHSRRILYMRWDKKEGKFEIKKEENLFTEKICD